MENCHHRRSNDAWAIIFSNRGWRKRGSFDERRNKVRQGRKVELSDTLHPTALCPDFIPSVCTETYYRRFRGHEEPGHKIPDRFRVDCFIVRIVPARGTVAFGEQTLPSGSAAYWLPSAAALSTSQFFTRD